MTAEPTRPDWLARVGVTVAPIGIAFERWRDAAVRIDRAGFAGIWTWDHLASRGSKRPILEAWTSLAALASVTSRATLGTLVTNVMVRHPAHLARVVATVHEASLGRAAVGIGIGGDPAEHDAYGLPLPAPAERVERLLETVAILRALWSGGSVTRDSPDHPLRDALAEPVLDPPPAILVAGQTREGARMAARAGEGWTTRPDLLERLLPVYRTACEAAGRSPGRVVVGFEGPRAGIDYVAGTAWERDPEAELDAWRRRGVDDVVLTARTPADVDALERMAGR